MVNQAAHLKEQALGTVGALTDPFTTLASTPTRFIGIGLSWKNDFTGIAQGIASNVENMGDTGKSFRESWKQRLTAADTVSETDILNLFQNTPPEIAARASRGFLAAREEGEKRLVLSHTMSDTASNLMIAAKDAVESYKGLQNNTNLSNTALAQSQIAGTVTQGNLTAAMAQLMAYYAAKEAAQVYEGEITRREALTDRGCLTPAERTRLQRAPGRACCHAAKHARRHALSGSDALRRAVTNDPFQPCKSNSIPTSRPIFRPKK